MTTLDGFDISYWQNSVPAGQFVIVRSSYGLTKDPKFSGFWSQLHGKPRGAYHYAHTSNDPTKEADFFVSVVKPVLSIGDIVVLDHENPGSSAAHDAAWALTFLKRVTSLLGFKPLVYTYISFAKEGRCNGLGGYKLWIADPSSPKGHPRVPAPWTSAVMHQYGTVNKVDADVFFGDVHAFTALGKPPIPTPTPLPAPKPVMPTLKLGAKGTAVKTLQTALNKHHGSHLSIDGNFGSATEKEVKGFQSARKLTADGVVGPKTWAALGY